MRGWPTETGRASPSFNRKFMTLFASNIRIGLVPTGIVLPASLTNLVLLNCWAFLRTATTVRLPDQTSKDSIKYESKH